MELVSSPSWSLLACAFPCSSWSGTVIWTDRWEAAVFLATGVPPPAPTPVPDPVPVPSCCLCFDLSDEAGEGALALDPALVRTAAGWFRCVREP